MQFDLLLANNVGAALPMPLTAGPPARRIRIRMSRRHKMGNQCFFALTAGIRSDAKYGRYAVLCASWQQGVLGVRVGLQIDLARAQDPDEWTRTD